MFSGKLAINYCGLKASLSVYGVACRLCVSSLLTDADIDFLIQEFFCLDERLND